MSNLEKEPNDSFSNANILTDSVGKTGQASSSEDIDYYKLYASKEGTIEFSLILSDSVKYLIGGYELNLYDSDGLLQRTYTTNVSGEYSIASEQAGYVYATISAYWIRDDYEISGLFSPASSDDGITSSAADETFNGDTGTNTLICRSSAANYTLTETDTG